MLYIISTPIGNLKDITLRALETLKDADIIASEDTRRTGKLLSNYNLRGGRRKEAEAGESAPATGKETKEAGQKKQELISYNESNERRRIPYLIGQMKEGKEVCLVSDCGTPGISDPGFKLIRETIKQGIRIVPVPGANAAISAIVSSGFPTDRFSFYGFFPKKDKAKKDMLAEIRSREDTAVIYESPYRIHKTLELMKEHIPKKEICIAREMTKHFEEFLRGTPCEIIASLGNRALKGEIVIVVSK